MLLIQKSDDNFLNYSTVFIKDTVFYYNLHLFVFAKSLKEMQSTKCWFITLLVALFGTGSWIAITGLWLEMPLLIARLPESWRLASRLNVVIQLANLGPLVYWAALKLRLANDISGTYAQLIVGLISCAVLIFGWQTTVSIGGSEHSAVLMACTFGLALVDCTSSVTFLTFVARFDSVYMAPYLVGEGE